MLDVATVNQILSLRNGVWTGVAILAVGLFRFWPVIPAVMAQWLARRQAVAAEKAADWDRLREEVKRLAGRVETLEIKVDECERREDEWRGRAITAEAELAKHKATEIGLGQARQEAAMIVAAERAAMAEAAKKERGK